jgi:hypothetical protein
LALTRWVRPRSSTSEEDGSPTQKNHHVELKQGFCELADTPVEDANLFENVLQTAVAMANYSQDSEGLILIGVAGKESAATRVKELFGVDPIAFPAALI